MCSWSHRTSSNEHLFLEKLDPSLRPKRSRPPWKQRANKKGGKGKGARQQEGSAAEGAAGETDQAAGMIGAMLDALPQFSHAAYMR